MPALPGRTPLLHRRQYFRGGRCHPVSVHGRARGVAGVEGMGDHVLDRIGSPECFDGLGVPGGPLLGQTAGFVLGLPSLQSGLLRQLHRLD